MLKTLAATGIFLGMVTLLVGFCWACVITHGLAFFGLIIFIFMAIAICGIREVMFGD